MATSLLSRTPVISKAGRELWNGLSRVRAATALTRTIQSSSVLRQNDSFLSGTNAAVIEEYHQRWMQNPKSVHPSWDRYFSEFGASMPAGAGGAVSEVLGDSVATAADTLKLSLLIRAYRTRGHLVADLDPLKLRSHSDSLVPVKTLNELDPSYYGFTESDLDRKFYIGTEMPGPNIRTLRDIIDVLKRTYCGQIGVEYRHMLSRYEKNWLEDKIERLESHYPLDNEVKKQIYHDLAEAELFEKFCANKFSNAKRFGLEGGEALIPAMQELLRHASRNKVEDVVIGMPHRGRLNVLANIMEKNLAQIFHEFSPTPESISSVLGSGDVKYHLGTSNDRKMPNNTMHLSLVANPSHLEAVDPVVIGKTRAKQLFKKDTERTRVMSVLLHGDAAFAGQGVVAETIELSDLRDYTTGGTIHIVINNQIGFTTDPKYARSSPYPTDVAKITGVPIFHVNGDNPEAVVNVCKIALEYRQNFHKDVVVDIFCYRRQGHNEMDNPSFTQPLMYNAIRKHPSTLNIYRDRLVAEGVLTADEAKKIEQGILGRYEEKFKESKNYVPNASDWLSSKWKGFKSMKQVARINPTGVPLASLQELGQRISTIPKDFVAHPTVKRLYDARHQMVNDASSKVDWGMGESLAFASLLKEGFVVRLSGQDVERGTFSHRHHVLHDQTSEKVYLPLNNLAPEQAVYEVCNSNLSEFAVLGFEHGYSLESPNTLVCWEAQFGDFVNGAQVLIDQFITSGEQKWLRQSGLVMMLPHGYDGQGPEHSSARLERFLAACDDDPDSMPEGDEVLMQPQSHNLQVCNITTPANYFHVLRRQIHREYRKPLIIMSPKALLRHPQCVSPLSEFGQDQQFHRVLPEVAKDLVADDKVRRLIFCSGKVYYDLLNDRDSKGIKDVALVRLEQIAPFPHHRIAEQLQKYKNAQVMWVQEEPKNMGAWFYTNPRISTVLRYIKDKRTPVYVGRNAAASPATGLAHLHNVETRNMLNTAFAA
eukprot:TRINITY_DN2468_c0_g1::TRINITY_DN2468_c0_g1_i1::g.8967::m.8967 TRINITY_DN2468_c0_g1::TRINITY_DN2468_c0_g1_i1::g.8967  ORF type:complete len:1010 (-),score=333.22,sp/Q54JE4/ODO1_DICDI/49.38/0.0,Transket_pyr/PF02779.19/1.4e-64,E1_dh/PF00676.15/1.9e-62,HrpB4/PF09502.5/0.3 TRINITY_DN2468_c0_g1_i1:885-3851(-)